MQTTYPRHIIQEFMYYADQHHSKEAFRYAWLDIFTYWQHIENVNLNKTNTVGQIIVLNHVLTSYPMDLPFQQILNLIHSGNDEPVIQDNFTNWDTNTLCNFIEELVKDIDQEIAIAMT
jgi:hypothetical protein